MVHWMRGIRLFRPNVRGDFGGDRWPVNVRFDPFRRSFPLDAGGSAHAMQVQFGRTILER